VSGLRPVAAEDWDGLLARLGCADVYLRSAYLESGRLLEAGEPTFLHYEGDGGDVVFPFLLREVEGGRNDVVTPYGYGGPVARGSGSDARGFYGAYEEWCGEQGVVSTFIRFHPLFANHAYAGPQVHLDALGDTVGWRLQGRDLLAEMHRSHRNKCRKAERSGVVVGAVEGPAELSGFVSLWEITMERVGAGEFYFFPAPYWELFTTALREQVVRFDATLGGELVASALCFATAPWLHYHLGATSDRARDVGASNFVLYEAARWGAERGFERFHLGGGVGGRADSLQAFKLEFDPGGALPMRIGKIVHDRRAYEELSGRDPADLEGFFPAYRQPPG
jgi:serine/alanine adding enzyme